MARKPAKPSQAVIRILNVLPSRDTEKDWQLEHAIEAGIAAAAPIPVAKDLREKWWNIGDQGSTGSCVGWAVADSLLRYHFVKAGKLKNTETLSQRFVWMASKETDIFTTRPTTFIEEAGTFLKDALDVARKFGAVREPLLPFGTGALFDGKTEVFYAAASQFKIASYFNLGTDPAKWRQWLATSGPVLTRLDVDRTWMDAKKTKGKLDVYDPASRQGGHAVALVGYTASTFIVRNSWGIATWGDQGFGHASNAYASAAFTEAYGISVA